ncbi:hypothetical protein HD553DRAFT_326319 [Filobasidium floriforme]|uniref:uncharacterized protein n=1 Tax=Filobasidium floriforme TaxID=5210 RepID=UPI001E8E4B49|nr:uncharacterized protein HD553DRAFT_326319 [Filobasidium floriforme]KAH8080010.1 hypothetical protein HD553DRAFT_326319 [Filobasidium floriforme]
MSSDSQRQPPETDDWPQTNAEGDIWSGYIWPEHVVDWYEHLGTEFTPSALEDDARVEAVGATKRTSQSLECGKDLQADQGVVEARRPITSPISDPRTRVGAGSSEAESSQDQQNLGLLTLYHGGGSMVPRDDWPTSSGPILTEHGSGSIRLDELHTQECWISSARETMDSDKEMALSERPRRRRSETTKRKIREAALGRIMSPEARAKISEHTGNGKRYRVTQKNGGTFRVDGEPVTSVTVQSLERVAAITKAAKSTVSIALRDKQGVVKRTFKVEDLGLSNPPHLYTSRDVPNLRVIVAYHTGQADAPTDDRHEAPEVSDSTSEHLLVPSTWQGKARRESSPPRGSSGNVLETTIGARIKKSKQRNPTSKAIVNRTRAGSLAASSTACSFDLVRVESGELEQTDSSNSMGHTWPQSFELSAVSEWNSAAPNRPAGSPQPDFKGSAIKADGTRQPFKSAEALHQELVRNLCEVLCSGGSMSNEERNLKVERKYRDIAIYKNRRTLQARFREVKNWVEELRSERKDWWHPPLNLPEGSAKAEKLKQTPPELVSIVEIRWKLCETCFKNKGELLPSRASTADLVGKVILQGKVQQGTYLGCFLMRLHAMSSWGSPSNSDP